MQSLIDIRSTEKIDLIDWNILEDIWQCLIPIEIAVSALCRRHATLLSAEGIYRFLMDQLDKNSSIDFCQELKSTVELRFRDERRQVNIVNLHRYLLNPFEISRSQKHTLVSTVGSLILRLFPSESSSIDRKLTDGEINSEDNHNDQDETQCEIVAGFHNSNSRKQLTQ